MIVEENSVMIATNTNVSNAIKSSARSVLGKMKMIFLFINVPNAMITIAMNAIEVVKKSTCAMNAISITNFAIIVGFEIFDRDNSVVQIASK